MMSNRDPLDPKIPDPGNGLPQEPNPLDPTPNVDVLDPNIPSDPDDADNDTQSVLAPGFGVPEAQPSF